MDVLIRVLSHWSGPLSIAISIEESQLHNLIATICQFEAILSRKNLDIHLLYNTGVSVDLLLKLLRKCSEPITVYIDV